MEFNELIRNKLFLSIAGGVLLTGFLGGGIYFETEHIAEVETEIEGVRSQISTAQAVGFLSGEWRGEIGRASCRERVFRAV